MTTQIGSPWTSERYYEIDHCLVKRHWRNSILDIQSDPYTNVNTDRYMTKLIIRPARKAKEEIHMEPTLKGITIPEENEDNSFLNFNEQVANTLIQKQQDSQQEATLQDLCNAMEDAARNNLHIKPPGRKKKDCHPEIKALIGQRLRALQDNGYEAIKDITKLLKKTARRIRVNQQITSLKDHAWEPVKYLKKNVVARHTKNERPLRKPCS